MTADLPRVERTVDGGVLVLDARSAAAVAEAVRLLAMAGVPVSARLRQVRQLADRAAVAAPAQPSQPPATDPGRMLTVEQVACRLGVSPQRVRFRLARGDAPGAVRVAGSWQVPERWVDDQETTRR